MGDGCCGETGAFGLVLIIVALLVNAALGIGCIVIGVVYFLWKKDYGQAIRILYLVGLIIVGTLIVMLMIVAVIAFSLTETGRDAALACFVITFFIELILFLVLFFAFFRSWRMGDKWNLNLVAVFAVPVGMAFCVLAVLLLLIERTSIGSTALTIIVIIAVVLSFIFFIIMVVGIIFLIIYNVRTEHRVWIWVIVVLLIIGAIIDLIGSALAASFDRNLTTGAIGFIICALVTGILLCIFLFYWFFTTRKDESTVAHKWSILTLGCCCAFFLAVALIGLLCLGGLWITDQDPGL